MNEKDQTYLYWSQGNLQGSSALLACCCCSCYLDLRIFFRLSGAAASFPPGIFWEEVSQGRVGVASLCWLHSYQGERLLQVWPHHRILLSLLPNDFLKVFLAAYKLQEKLFCS